MTITGHSFSQLIDQGKVDDHLTDKLVNRPDHYTGGNVECVEAIKAATQGLPALKLSASATSSATFGATASSTPRIPSWMSRSLSITSTGSLPKLKVKKGNNHVNRT
jgi:hypothetical protein